MNVFGGIKINKKQNYTVIDDNVIRKQSFDEQNIQQTNENILANIKNNHLIKQQPPYDDMMINYFKSNIEIYKNGEKVNHNEYKDYNSELSPYYNKPSTNNSYKSNKTSIQPTNEPVEQVDPSTFFGNSLNSLVQKLK